MDTHRVVASTLLVFALAHSAIGDIPGATLTDVTNLSAPVYPRSLAAGADGKIWFSDEGPTLPHSVGYFTSDGHVTKFAVPCDQCNGSGDRLAYIESIAVGPDGNGWFPYTYVNGDGSPLNGGMNSFVGRVTPAGQFTSFAVPTVDAFRRFIFGAAGHSAITAGPDGNLWFTENSPGKIGKITTAGVVTDYALPSAFSSPSIITTGADGNLWFTESAAGKIGRITPGGAIAEFTTPRGLVFNSAPFGITAGPDGNVWYTDHSGGLGRVTPAGVVTRFELETNANPADITSATDRKLYFSYTVPSGTSYQGKIAQFDPSTVSSLALGRMIETVAETHAALLGAGIFGGEMQQANGVLYFVGTFPDPTGTIYLDKLLSLQFGRPCIPPITINGQASPVEISVTLVNGQFDQYASTLSLGGFTYPITDESLTGDVPAGVEPYHPAVQNVFALAYIGLHNTPGVYNFAYTITDARGCTATVNYHVTVKDAPPRREAVRH